MQTTIFGLTVSCALSEVRTQHILTVVSFLRQLTRYDSRLLAYSINITTELLAISHFTQHLSKNFVEHLIPTHSHHDSRLLTYPINLTLTLSHCTHNELLTYLTRHDLQLLALSHYTHYLSTDFVELLTPAYSSRLATARQ